MKNYFIVIDGQKEGPMTLDELINVIVDDESLVWTKGMDSWKPANTFPEIINILEEIPPPIPTPSEINAPSSLTSTFKQPQTHKLSKEQKSDSTNRTLTKSNPEGVKRKTANEIKTNVKIFVCALLLGAVSYPAWFSFEGGPAFKKDADLFSSSEYVEEIRNYFDDKGPKPYNYKGTTGGFSHPQAGDMFKYFGSQWNADPYQNYTYNLQSAANSRLDDVRILSVQYSIGVFIGSFLLMAVGRYLLLFAKQGTEWVNKHSD